MRAILSFGCIDRNLLQKGIDVVSRKDIDVVLGFKTLCCR